MAHSEYYARVYDRFISNFQSYYRYTGTTGSDGSNPKRQVTNRTDSEEKCCKIERPLSSASMISHLRNRELGLSYKRNIRSARKQFLSKDLPDFISQQLPGILSEKELFLGTVNKIFAAKWLNKSQVVMGSKCNKLMVMDVTTNQIDFIPSLKSSPLSVPARCPCGIHCIAINPSGTMLATGAQNTNDMAVYELPTFDPLCVGEQGHKDWIFDMDWIDDAHVVTGSRDDAVALWRIDNQDAVVTHRGDGDMIVPSHRIIKPCITKPCAGAEKVRALALGRNKKTMGVLSMNARFHFWDIELFKQLETLDLPWRRENVCMASSDEYGIFAVGSQSYVTLLDHRQRNLSTRYPLKIPPNHGERGIRSLSFTQNMITIGGGFGGILFYDMRAKNFLQLINGSCCQLRVGQGWLNHDANYREHFMTGQYPNAIYAHCYDDWNARLFVAGGPLPAGLHGNYAGIFY